MHSSMIVLTYQIELVIVLLPNVKGSKSESHPPFILIYLIDIDASVSYYIYSIVFWQHLF